MNKIKSLLFVPSNEKFLAKIPTLVADAIIFDLEDSVLPENKQMALELLKKNLTDFQNEKKSKWFVRLNKENALFEAAELDLPFIDGFMLPKFENSQEYHYLEKYNKIIIALIETPMGMVGLSEISNCSYVSALAFGAQDYTASVNMINQDDYLNPVKSMLVNYAKAYKKFVYDTPCFTFRDEEQMKKEVQNSANLGFDGKLAINPKQIEIINEAFLGHDFDYMREVIAEFKSRNVAVMEYNGKIYEKMHIDRFQKILNS